MAKHNIYPSTSEQPPVRRIELHWQRCSGVQLATTSWAGEQGSVPDTALEYLPGTSANGPDRAWDGSFIDLDRDGINHLIKQLRSARDQAFGRDE